MFVEVFKQTLQSILMRITLYPLFCIIKITLILTLACLVVYAIFLRFCINPSFSGFRFSFNLAYSAVFRDHQATIRIRAFLENTAPLQK